MHDAEQPSRQAGDARKPLIEHLEELRARLWWCLAAVAAGGAATYAVRDSLMAWLIAPVGQVVFTGLAEPFLAGIRLAVWGGVILGFPMLLWQAWEFLAAGLTPTERRRLGRLLPLGVLLFAGGAWLGLTQLVPASVRFFLGFASPQMVPMLSVDRYLGFVGSLMLACGLIAQAPLVIAALAAAGIVTPAFLVYHWRAAVVGSFCLSAVATPTPDIFTQTALAAALLGLYGISIGIAAVVQPRRPMAWQPVGTQGGEP